jgi:beta-lactam-binding protein with PASTA domain
MCRDHETSTQTLNPVAATASAESHAGTGVVPDGAGKNYQEAQDLWRAAGLTVLPATDATAAHRLPLIDSNWVVMAQDLKPGTKVTEGASITATVKKYTDG